MVGKAPLLTALLLAGLVGGTLLLGGGRPAPAPAGGVPAAGATGHPTATGAASPSAARADLQPNLFYDAALFYQGLKEAEAMTAPRGEGALVGGLVPHHNLAGAMFSIFFLEMQERPPETLIVVGPDHDHRGQRIATGRRGWATDFGPVEADRELVDWLVKTGLAALDDDALTPEHSIGALMPYLKYHTPETRVVPITLHKDVTPDEAGRLAAALAPLLGPKVWLVASVDFSHYLTRAEAEAKDVITRQAIRDFDLPRLWRMGPDFIDSPPSLGLLMLTMRRIGAAGPEFTAHTNSGVILSNDLIETTSYFTLTYRLAP